MSHESMDFDVLIVGAGPAGLASAIRLAQLAAERHLELNIAIIDKGAEIGAHILSGAVLEPRALNELIPDWQQKNPPTMTPAGEDEFLYLTATRALRLPTPKPMQNHGNYIISLGQFCRWLAQLAEQLGINVFPGFAATETIIEAGVVKGVITGDLGIDRHGKPKAQYQPGIALRAKQTIFAEGCRGSLTQLLFKQFNLRQNCDPQTYGLGIKELWEVTPAQHRPGKIIHTIGWPLDHKTYGGSFIYHFGKNLVATGLVVGLDYRNPYLSPFQELQRFKHHPAIRDTFNQGRRIAYGARTLIEGGLQSLPKLTVPGGVIVGDAAGFLNVPKIKGIHNAMKSGMVAAESIFPLLNKAEHECLQYTDNIKQSWLWQDLHRVRNIRPAFRFGLWPALAYSAFDTYILRGKAPWTFHHHQADNDSLQQAAVSQPIDYPKPDGKISFDLPSSVYLANVHYDEDQPYHLKLTDRHHLPIDVNYKQYAAPETRYCPAGVYEIVITNQPRLQINGGNCIHCKACDIKDPLQNIRWTPSEGGSGPQYGMM